MPRSTPQWQGRTDDSAAPPRVKQRVFDRDGGKCHWCGETIQAGRKWALDHVLALIAGGPNHEGNMAPICDPCHKEKTAGEVAEKAKVAAVRQRHLGITKPSGKFQKAPKEKREGKASLPPRRMFA
jgi:5-methylcytosine-specific restriction endonuclease McrA